MKAEDKTAIPRVRIAVIGHADVGKSGKSTSNAHKSLVYKPSVGIKTKTVID